MQEATISQKVRELIEIIKAFPAAAGTKRTSADGTYVPCNDPNHLDCEQSLDYLRMQLKYLLFDLEATRRESRYLREMLENHFTRPCEDNDEDDDLADE